MIKNKLLWTKKEYDELNNWHKSVISQYPIKIQIELRGYRVKFLGGIGIV